jgi:lipid-A-disaccharide synthase
MFVAGDPSGDEHASHVISQLKLTRPDIATFGIGGPHMKAEGFMPLLPFEPFNRMGFAEVLKQLPFFLSAKALLVKELKEKRPAALVCVDYPGFNIPLAKAANKLGIPVVWYIVPQVWAWKKKRAETLGNCASFIGVVFPFEAAYFSPYKARVEFVGHPLVELLEKKASGNGHGPDSLQKVKTLALVPGSRKQEILHMLGPMADAAILLKQKHPEIQVIVSKCNHLSNDLFHGPVEKLKKEFLQDVIISSAPLGEVLSQCQCAIVTSGTATLHTALMTIPHVVAYKTSAITFTLLRSMITLPFIGLPNIVAQEKIVPECIQDQVTGKDLCNAIAPFFEDKELYEKTKQKLGGLRKKLGGKKPSEEMAKVIIAIVTSNKK